MLSLLTVRVFVENIYFDTALEGWTFFRCCSTADFLSNAAKNKTGENKVEADARINKHWLEVFFETFQPCPYHGHYHLCNFLFKLHFVRVLEKGAIVAWETGCLLPRGTRRSHRAGWIKK